MTTRNLGKLFDQSSCKKRFLYQFKITEIEQTNLQDLVYILLNMIPILFLIYPKIN